MNEHLDQQARESETESIENRLSSPLREIPDQDDRFPGSFFRIPGAPVPGKTTWSIS
ncbi:MAG: hypothetical protein ACU84H_17450 [Gammaproteobacteria bacterium]